MRKCNGKYYKNGEWKNFVLADFHQWGNQYEEFESGPGNYSVAIVELLDGSIVTPMPDWIQFIN